MSDGKKGGGLFGSLGDKLKAELFEGDDTAKPIPKAAPASAPAPAAAPSYAAPPPVISGTTPYTFGTTASVPEPLDDAALSAVNDGVFGGDPTHYVHFMTMWETLGRPADPSIALKAMQAMDKSISGAVILSDINAHLSRLDAVTAKADTDFEGVATERLGGADATLAQLQQANDAAAAEIVRHQTETAARITQISQVTQQRATDEAAIGRAKAKTVAAEAAVKQQLLNMQSLFANL